MKSVLQFLLFSGVIFLASCTKNNDELPAKADRENAEEKLTVTSIPWPRTSLKRVSVFLQGAQMVPAISTPAKGTLALNLFSNKYVGYRLTVTNLEPGDYATGAILYQGEPGNNGTPVFSLSFFSWENGVNKNLLLTDDQFNTLSYLLTPPVLPLIPNCYFVVTTFNHPAGLIRGKVIL
jgi:hypothetical protein